MQLVCLKLKKNYKLSCRFFMKGNTGHVDFLMHTVTLLNAFYV